MSRSLVYRNPFFYESLMIARLRSSLRGTLPGSRRVDSGWFQRGGGLLRARDPFQPLPQKQGRRVHRARHQRTVHRGGERRSGTADSVWTVHRGAASPLIVWSCRPASTSSCRRGTVVGRMIAAARTEVIIAEPIRNLVRQPPRDPWRPVPNAIPTPGSVPHRIGSRRRASKRSSIVSVCSRATSSSYPEAGNRSTFSTLCLQDGKRHRATLILAGFTRGECTRGAWHRSGLLHLGPGPGEPRPSPPGERDVPTGQGEEGFPFDCQHGDERQAGDRREGSGNLGLSSLHHLARIVVFGVAGGLGGAAPWSCTRPCGLCRSRSTGLYVIPSAARRRSQSCWCSVRLVSRRRSLGLSGTTWQGRQVGSFRGLGWQVGSFRRGSSLPSRPSPPVQNGL